MIFSRGGVRDFFLPLENILLLYKKPYLGREMHGYCSGFLLNILFEILAFLTLF